MPTSADLAAKARALLERRDMRPGMGYYWRTQWKRQLIFLLLYAAVIAGLYTTGQTIPAAIFLGFAIGRTIRDVNWYRALAREWPTSLELLDWEKIEALARENDVPSD